MYIFMTRTFIFLQLIILGVLFYDPNFEKWKHYWFWLVHPSVLSIFSSRLAIYNCDLFLAQHNVRPDSIYIVAINIHKQISVSKE